MITFLRLIFVIYFILSTLIAISIAFPGRDIQSENKFSEDNYSIVPLEGYTSKTDSLLIYIVQNVNLADETCTLQFENCLFNENNNEELIKYNKHEKPLSPRCSLLLKAKYCLLYEQYTSECLYDLIADKVQIYMKSIDKNIEACSYYLPFEKRLSI